MQSFASNFDALLDSLKMAIRVFLESACSFLNIFSDFTVGAVLIISIFVIMMGFGIIKTKNGIGVNIRKPAVLAVCAMLIAINVILGYFSLNLTSYLRIGFGFITTPVSASLFGPVLGGLTAASADVASYILKPTGGFLFTYTLNTGIAGIIQGFMLYNKKPSLLRIFLTKLIETVFVNIFLNSVALAPTAGSGLIGIMPARIIKNILLLPVQTTVIYIVLNTVVCKIKQMR